LVAVLRPDPLGKLTVLLQASYLRGLGTAEPRLAPAALKARPLEIFSENRPCPAVAIVIRCLFVLSGFV